MKEQILKHLKEKKEEYNENVKNLEFTEQGMEHNYNVIDTYKALNCFIDYLINYIVDIPESKKIIDCNSFELLNELYNKSIDFNIKSEIRRDYISLYIDLLRVIKE